MSGDTITIPLGYVISIASPILLSLVSAIVYLARRAEAAERGRLDDLKASGAAVSATQEKALPLLERVATELRLLNDWRLQRAQQRAALGSDPPVTSRPSGAGDLEDTLTELRRAEEATAAKRQELADKLRGGTTGVGK